MSPIKKIIITGPESSGKTTLAKQLAAHYETVWVPEYARSYLDSLNRDYVFEDLSEIAKGQIKLEESLEPKANTFLFCDTSMLVMKIWSEFKYGKCNPEILRQLELRKKEVFLLCGTEIPWEFDELRESQNERETLYKIYKKELLNMGASFLEIQGSPEERLYQVVEYLKDHSLAN